MRAAARPRPRRRTGDQLSKLSDTLAALAGSKCVASYIRDEHGDVFLILMADGCPPAPKPSASSESVSAPAQPLLRPALAHPAFRDTGPRVNQGGIRHEILKAGPGGHGVATSDVAALHVEDVGGDQDGGRKVAAAHGRRASGSRGPVVAARLGSPPIVVSSPPTLD